MTPHFYDRIRPLFPGGRLTTQQVEGIEYIVPRLLHRPLQHIAYMIATVCIETAWTMQPITERGSRSYFDKYDTGKLAKALGNTPAKDGDGYTYRGRGYVQLTGVANYKRAGDKLGINLIQHPELALRPDVALKIMDTGMTEGWFTGKKLSDYLPTDGPGWSNARRVINGTDRAAEIGKIAQAFYAALDKEYGGRPVAKPTIPVLTIPTSPDEAAGAAGGIAGLAVAVILAVGFIFTMVS